MLRGFVAPALRLMLISSDISSDISCDILSDIPSGILSDISSDILSDISFDMLSDMREVDTTRHAHDRG